MDIQQFLTAFAQCSATLIGIIGAFIIAKILDEGNNYVETEIEAHDLFKDGRVLEVKAANFNMAVYDKIRGDLPQNEKAVKMKKDHDKIEAKYKSHCAAQKSLLKSIKETDDTFKNLKLILLGLILGVLFLVVLPLAMQSWFSGFNAHCPGHAIFYETNWIIQIPLFLMLLLLVVSIFIYFYFQLNPLMLRYKDLADKFKHRYSDCTLWKQLLESPDSITKNLRLKDFEDSPDLKN